MMQLICILLLGSYLLWRWNEHAADSNAKAAWNRILWVNPAPANQRVIKDIPGTTATQRLILAEAAGRANTSQAERDRMNMAAAQRAFRGDMVVSSPYAELVCDFMKNRYIR
jgi:hypothetical protein